MFHRVKQKLLQVQCMDIGWNLGLFFFLIQIPTLNPSPAHTHMHTYTQEAHTHKQTHRVEYYRMNNTSSNKQTLYSLLRSQAGTVLKMPSVYI